MELTLLVCEVKVDDDAVVSMLADCSRGQHEGTLFNSYDTGM